MTLSEAETALVTNPQFWASAVYLLVRGKFEATRGDSVSALSYYTEAVAQLSKLHDLRNLAEAYEGVAEFLQVQEPERAFRLLTTAQLLRGRISVSVRSCDLDHLDHLRRGLLEVIGNARSNEIAAEAASTLESGVPVSISS